MQTSRMGAPERVTYDDWICVRAGRKFYFEDVSPSSIRLQDIATALARIARYGGHGERKYTVGEHSLRVHDAVLAHVIETACEKDILGKQLTQYQKQLCLHNALLKAASTLYFALMHDAVEAYIGDKVAPLKQYMGDFKAKENQIEAVAAKELKYDGDNIDHALVKQFDLRMLRTEKLQLLPWYPEDAWRNDHLDIVESQWRFEPEKKPFRAYRATRTETEDKVRTYFYERARAYQEFMTTLYIRKHHFDAYDDVTAVSLRQLIASLYSAPVRRYLRSVLKRHGVSDKIVVHFPVPVVPFWQRVKRSWGFYPYTVMAWGSNL